MARFILAALVAMTVAACDIPKSTPQQVPPAAEGTVTIDEHGNVKTTPTVAPSKSTPVEMNGITFNNRQPPEQVALIRERHLSCDILLSCCAGTLEMITALKTLYNASNNREGLRSVAATEIKFTNGMAVFLTSLIAAQDSDRPALCDTLRRKMATADTSGVKGCEMLRVGL